MKRIVLYSMEKCPHCQTAKRYLDEKNTVSFMQCENAKRSERICCHRDARGTCIKNRGSIT